MAYGPGEIDGWVALGQPNVLQGYGFLYRPRQVLLETGRPWEDQIIERLQREGGVLDEELDQELSRGSEQPVLPIRRYILPPEVDIPRLVVELRAHRAGDPVPNVGPNHVLCSEPNWEGGSGGEPQPAGSLNEAPWEKANDEAPGIAVLDTGFDPSVPFLHPGLKWRIVYPSGTEENPITSSGYFAQQAGHGTFNCGICMRVAPQVRIRQVRVLDPAGITDDLCVAKAMVGQADAPVINLSLGGYTQQDRPPTASSVALRRLDENVVVVAASGNHGSDEPFWPAAFKRVIGVGALDTTNGQQKLATFSNYGDWVNIYAPGVNVLSTYLKGMWKLPTDTTGWFIDGWATWQGTSFAAPQVAAAIADIARQPGVTARQAALRVLSHARWVTGPGANGGPGWPGGWSFIPVPGVVL
jgi:hypothetical protein